MRSNQTTRSLGVRGIAVAIACTLALTGCSNLPFELPFELPELPELPFELPDFNFDNFELPFELPDLSGIPNPFAGTSVEEACDEALASAKSSLAADELVKPGYLTVGIKANASAPLVITGNGDTVRGVDVDVASALADSFGLKVRFVSVTDTDEALTSGLCDVVMGASSESVATSTVGGGYCESATAFFHKGGSGVVTVDKLNGATVGVQEGSVSQGLLEATALQMKQETFSNLNEAFEALASGTVDYVLCDAYSGAYLASAYDGISFVGALNAPTQLGVATSPSKPALQGAVDEALSSIQGNGVMDIVRANWIGGMAPISVEQMVQNVPMPQPEVAEGEEGELQDGSTAGANAATPY